MIDSPQLTFRELDHTYWVGPVRLPSVTEIIGSHGLISEFAKNDEAALRGVMAHLACRYLLEGRLDWSTVGMLVLPYVVSLNKWLELTGFKAEVCEAMGYHPLLMVAGTCDVIGVHPKLGRCLFDLKTGQTCAGWHHLQTAGYQIIQGGYYKRGCLHLQRDGSIARFYPHRSSLDRAKFMACKTVYDLKEAA